LVASAGYAYVMLTTATVGSRLLTQNIHGWQAMQMATHLAGFAMLIGVAQLLWNHPSRLGGAWFGWVLAALSALFLSLDWNAWVDSIAIGFRLPVALFGLLLMGLTWTQWRASAGDPVKRAQVRWLSFLFASGFALSFAAYLVGTVGESVRTPQVYGMAWNALFFLGLVPLVTRVGLFQLEAWWVRAWLWFAGGLLVLVLDVVLVSQLSMPSTNALLVATAFAGWAYFPIRQWLWQRIAGTRGMDAQTLLPDILRLVQGGGRGLSTQVDEWKALWERCFQPARTTEWVGDAPSTVSLLQDGAALCVPGPSGLPGLRLEHVLRGRRLFSRSDAILAQEIVELVQAGLDSARAYERGAREERHRVASDLHDDLGASLLSIAQSNSAQRSAELARLAMDDLRLSVRGLTGDQVSLQDTVSDWRAETVSRLSAAGVGCVWEASALDMSNHKIPSSVRMQLTRVLREAVSNVIKHSGASSCRVEFQLLEDSLRLQISDDGCGMPLDATTRSQGLGLAGMERRVRGLGGNLDLKSNGGEEGAGGACLAVSVPLTSSTHEIRADR
jgi:signal transduction histidine kinase